MHLDIQVGEHAIDYANVAQKEKLSELQLRVRQLLDQVEQITKEQNYQRVSTIKFVVKCFWIYGPLQEILPNIAIDNIEKYFLFVYLNLVSRGKIPPD